MLRQTGKAPCSLGQGLLIGHLALRAGLKGDPPADDVSCQGTEVLFLDNPGQTDL